MWIIFPVLVELSVKPAISIDWEHTEYKWINPNDLRKYEIVADLDKTLLQVMPEIQFG
jgi:hypothetical protein